MKQSEPELERTGKREERDNAKEKYKGKKNGIKIRRLISISINYTRTLSAFPCGRTQHLRRMRSSIVSMKESALEFRCMRVIPHSRLNGR